MQNVDFYSLLGSQSSEPPRPDNVVSAHELQSLLAPISIADFNEKFFGRLPLRIKGNAGKFHRIFGWNALVEALKAGEHLEDPHYAIKAAFSQGGKSKRALRMIPTYYRQLTELLQAGATVCVTNLHLADSFLQDWVASIRDELKYPGYVGINCYISPDESGFAMHYDARVATSIQISGVKRWRYSTRPAKAWPTQNAVFDESTGKAVPDDAEDIGMRPPEMEFNEVDMEPGDLLCLPAGTWHAAQAIDHSLALNLYFQPVRDATPASA